MTARPSDPNVAITGSIFVKTLPKNGAEVPNKIETRIDTATIKPRSFVASNNQFFTFNNELQLKVIKASDRRIITLEIKKIN